MKKHSKELKNNIKKLGRILDDKITYTINGEEITLGGNVINSITPHYESELLKSTMKQLDIDSNVEIPIGTILTYDLGVRVGNNFEYLNFGNYIVNSVRKREDTKSWEINCCDKMIYSMVDYVALDITYPITINNYINAICSHLGLTFANYNEDFPNHDKEIENELYLSTTGNNLNYTFRDVLNELAEVTASIICINNDDELELRYANDTIGNNLFEIKDADYTGQSAWQYFGNSTYTKISNGYILSGSRYTAIGFQYDNLEEGQQYTISFDVIADETLDYSSSVGINQYSGADASIKAYKNFTVTNTLQRISWTFTAHETDRIAFRGGIITITNIQLEKGPTATPYEEFGLDEIDEEFFKDINVNFGEKYGPINSVVLSRAAESDNVYLKDEASILQNGLCEIKITDNQIMNFNNRADFLPDILEKLNGLEYYINDYSSTGICYYDLLDRYNVLIDNRRYSCLMLNDEINRTQGIEETVYTPMPEITDTDYKKADKTDRKIDKAYLIVDKQNQVITGIVEKQSSIDENLEKNYYTKTETNEFVMDTVKGITNRYIVGGGNNLLRNTGLYFETSTDKYSSGFEFWNGSVKRVTNMNSKSKTSMYLQNDILAQEQEVSNDIYTISFKYNKLNELATANVKINNILYELDGNGFFSQTISITYNKIEIEFNCDTNDGYEIYELMCNFGETALSYSQNANETKTDTVEISEGIKIASDTTESIFKANADGIRVENSNGNVTTEFLDTGTKTTHLEAQTAEIANLLIQEIDGQIWLTGLGR